jgi:hypothetical protein
MTNKSKQETIYDDINDDLFDEEETIEEALPRIKAIDWRKIDSKREEIELRKALSDFEDYEI